jgi:small subunit ribosomal protein S4e
MGRGPNKHLKRLATPRKWMLSKMGGIYATRPS